jgi:hypothetical protein
MLSSASQKMKSNENMMDRNVIVQWQSKRGGMWWEEISREKYEEDNFMFFFLMLHPGTIET